jgi:hypothetical protein
MVIGKAMRCSSGKFGVNVEPLRLEAGEAAGDGLEGVANRFEMVQAFLETEVGEVVGA